MGKEQHKDNASKTYVLKVIMHCQCNGCIKKINDGSKFNSLAARNSPIKNLEHHKDDASNTCVLKVIMHCQCNGCIKKINDGVREIALSEGVERADLVVETAEVIVVGRMDPEKLCCLLHELTQKHVKIETQTTVSEKDTAASQQTKNGVSQALASPGRLRNSLGSIPVMPSAPPLPETWTRLVVPSQRCAYRWSSPSPGELGVWAASDVTGTLAAYEL